METLPPEKLTAPVTLIVRGPFTVSVPPPDSVMVLKQYEPFARITDWLLPLTLTMPVTEPL